MCGFTGTLHHLAPAADAHERRAALGSSGPGTGRPRARVLRSATWVDRQCGRTAGFEPVQQVLLTDLTVGLPSTFLPKAGRATMTVRVEVRETLLDERASKLALGIDSQWKAYCTKRGSLPEASHSSHGHGSSTG